MNTRSTFLPHRPRHSGRRLLIVALVLAVALILAAAVQQSLAAASAAVPTAVPASTPNGPATGGGTDAGTDPAVDPSDADGMIRDGDQPSVHDVDRVAVGRLDPALLDALQRAADDARHDGVEFRVNSGWRSAALQERMLQDAIAQYGSETEASRWVATATTSAHVSGDAVDIGPLPALDWLAQRGWRYGLCQIYANESWHYELRPDAVTDGCPEMYTDPTEDPRMHP